MKIWCLHCEMVSESDNSKECPKCGAGFLDVEEIDAGRGFFRQAYPDIPYDEIVVDKEYPLYPKTEKQS